jgi:hypothetical protein
MLLRTTANGSSFRPSFKLLLLCLMRALTGECCTGSITIRPYTEPGPASVIANLLWNSDSTVLQKSDGTTAQSPRRHLP